MECKGNRIFISESKNSNFNLFFVSFVHDNDAASSIDVLKVFPNAIEYHDRLHRQRAIR